jgi:DNA-binding transcriptional ArsR family regulator
MNTTPAEHVPASQDRKLDVESLKALAHPLRVQILDRLSVHGAATASGLADALGESSGATSYHLRQLEKHGFAREVEGRGTGRERWWERTPGGISLSPEMLGIPVSFGSGNQVEGGKFFIFQVQDGNFVLVQ